MIIGILQPGYLPWLGFFEQLHRSDVFVLYDDVQYDKESWRNRNRIKTPTGAQWLTVPVRVKFEQHPLICEVKIDNGGNWKKKHLFSIRQNYSKAPFFHEYSGLFEEAYATDWEYLVDLDIYFVLKLAEATGIDTTKIVRSSTLAVEGDRIGRLVSISKRLGADTFYEGASGRAYMDEEVFLKNGIKVVFQDYVHPFYSQLHGEFIPHLSIIDLLFNHGPGSLPILTHSTSPSPDLEAPEG